MHRQLRGGGQVAASRAPRSHPRAYHLTSLVLSVFLLTAMLASYHALDVCEETGIDEPGCGLTHPCATLPFVLNIGFTASNNVFVSMCGGMFTSRSCGASVTSASTMTVTLKLFGTGNTTVDCDGIDRLLYISAPSLNVAISGLIIVNTAAGDDSMGGPSGGAVYVLVDVSGDAPPSAILFESTAVLHSSLTSSASGIVSGGAGVAVVFSGNGSSDGSSVSVMHSHFYNCSAVTTGMTGLGMHASLFLHRSSVLVFSESLYQQF